MAKLDLSALGIKSYHTFDQLVVGSNNQVAVASCAAVAKSPGETYNPLFIYGPAGVGKTHVMQAVANEMLRANPDCKIKYISAERFMSEIVGFITEDRVMELRSMYSQLDLLLLDDVQFLTESKVSQEELFHVFNNMHQQNRQVILAADKPPNQLTALSKTIRSRLEWGLACDIKTPNAATRLEILRKKQESQGLTMTDEMLIYVAQRLRSNVRELEGFLKRIHAYTTLSHQTITFDLVKSVVREILPEGMDDNPEPIDLNEVAQGELANGHVPPKQEMPKFPEAAPPPIPGVAPPPPTPRAVPPPPKPVPPAPVATAPPAGKPPAPQTQGLKPLSLFEKLKFEPPKQSEEEPPALHPALEPEPKPVAAKPPPVEKPVEKQAAPPVPEPLPAELVIGDMTEPDEEMPAGFKEIGAVFFFPNGSTEALESVHRKFQEVIKKHKLKFRLKRIHSAPYQIKGKIDYSTFVDTCKTHKVAVAIVIGPSPDAMIPEQDFYDLLTVTLDVQGISLQLINWGEINKDYRYLNLALDIALVRSR